MPIAPGTRVGRYEVSSQIGAGGMGEVYLATDMQLGRPVAIKILPEQFTTSKTHLRRFEQEARATSSLNHPNILTIYEIGQFESTYFIAAEFVKGETLRRLLSQQRLTLPRALDIAIQVASGLAAAHAAGVIHRDIKPENVMVREDGYVKVLDFGLAKLIQDQFQPLLANESASGEPASADTQTLSGTVVGTISYMSPEQLRGIQVDSRTDIWSLGVDLYEMVAGRAPFHGNSNADVIVTILEREFEPIKSYRSRCPESLERIINTSLAKDRDHRYKGIPDLLSDLTALRDEVKAGSQSEEALTLDLGRPLSGVRQSRSWGGARSVSSLNAVATVSLRRYQWLALGAVGVLILIAGGVWLARTIKATRHAGLSNYGEARLSKLIDTGKATDAAISPDGKYVAYTTEEGGKQSLWVKQLVGGNSVQVIAPADVRYTGMTFSPDVNYIYYVSYEKQDNVRRLFRIPILGVTPRKILDDVDTPISFSPDGRQITFVRGYPSEKRTALVIANADGTGERILATRASPDDFGWRGGPAWSPEGEHIACAVGNYDLSMRLVEVNVRDGKERQLLASGWPWIGRITWLPDGSGLLMVAKDQSTGFQQVWYVSNSGSELKRLTGDLDEFSSRSLSVTADSRNVVLVQTEFLSNIWISRAGDDLHAKQIGSGRSDGFNGLAWTPDGNIVYASRASGNLDIWLMDRSGENQKQLTSEAGSNYEPDVTRDGQFIVFTSTRAGHQDIWRMDISGSNAKQLTSASNASWPHCSPDGRYVIYKSYQSGKRTLWKVGIEGGERSQIIDKYTGWPDVSPDGKSIACEYWNEQPDSKIKLAILPFEGGVPFKEFYWPLGPALPVYLPRVISWTADGRAITYADNSGSVGNIWSQPIEGGEPRQLTNFQSERVFWFDWSKDGSQLAVARGVTVSDVVMITRIKPD